MEPVEPAAGDAFQLDYGIRCKNIQARVARRWRAAAPDLGDFPGSQLDLPDEIISSVIVLFF